MYLRTTAIKKIQALDKSVKIVQGGTGAGKTLGILSILIDKAQRSNVGTISVVSESMPHLRRGAMKDFLSIMTQHHYYKENNWNKTNFIYVFETGTVMEFFSADTSDKVHGPRRQILFLNEANHISYETYTQLELRTSGDIYLDFNPTQEFWAHTRLSNASKVVLTYKDNEGYPKESILRLESHKDNKAFWRVYGLGLIGELEESIYKDWKIIDEIPHEARLERRWLDFGYSADPTAIGDVYKYNDGYILDEHTYLSGLRNKDIADIILNLSPILTIADSAEPKSVDEIALYGVNIQGAVKGADSIRNGIQLIQQHRISVTKRSVNIIKEYRNYTLKRDRDGNLTNNPIDMFNHHMDGIRYAFQSLLGSVSSDVYRKQNERFDRNESVALNSTR